MEQSQSISAPQSRIHVLDALRGFALIGVILVHMLQHFGVFSGIRVEMPLFPVLDEAIQWLMRNVLIGKFINIFAFLFGLSFFIQMDRAAKKGSDFRLRFVWRMVVLFMIGIVGNRFFTADILPIYAAFGVVMVLIYPLKNWMLILIAALLFIGTPRIVKTNYDSMTKTEQVVETQLSRRTPPAEVKETPSFVNSAKRNLTVGFKGKLNYQFGMFGRGYITMALFILGLVVGRLQFFERIEIDKKRNLVLFALFATTATVIGMIPKEEVNFRMLMSGAEISPSVLLSMALNDIHTVLFSGALAMGFIILYQIKSIGKYLSVIEPFGRMGLTNYTVQSILGGTLFSMWGLGAIFGSCGTTEVFFLGLIIYAIQVVISMHWMKHFLYGSLEWFWRSATYFKIQPFRRMEK